ncbi:MAG: PspC family transcriptional regulator, partial [Prevotella sp.]|nr:PspC family transcriptional regulator [Prevotella sp.]
MKKNITINLFGTLYSIDEDAYMLLDSYIESMKKHFAGKEDGTEIANDIESRIAELMYELKEKGCEPLCIEQIRSIIERIGNPEDIDETTDEKTDNGNERGADEDGKCQDN